MKHSTDAEGCMTDCPACANEGERPPTEPTTAEAFATLRECLTRHICEDGDRALALLERRIQGSPPLAILVEAFCRDVEKAEAAREARRSGGQQVGRTYPFEHVTPSMAGELRRWARDFREALKK